jgi:hypothetical protein
VDGVSRVVVMPLTLPGGDNLRNSTANR